MTEAEQLVKSFWSKATKLDQLDRDLVGLEKDPENRERLASVFRTIHTIKGTCGFFGFDTLESVAHVGENLLSRCATACCCWTPKSPALLALLDAVRLMLGNIEKTGNDGDGDYTSDRDADPVAGTRTVADPSAVPRTADPSGNQGVQTDRRSPNRIGQSHRAEVLEAVQAQTAGDPLRFGEILVEEGNRSTQDVAKPLGPRKRLRGVAETNIRVDVSLLDKLMNLVGELVLARNQILQFYTSRRTLLS